MKKLLLLSAAIAVACFPAKAQTKFAKSGLWDNWYVGANVGFNSKLTHNTFMSHLNPHLTLRAGRDFNPVAGLMLEVTPFFNDQRFPAAKIGGYEYYSHTGVKAIDLDLLGNFNLSNLFRDYPGSLRFFEVRFIAGVGLNHVFGASVGAKNDFISKVGLDLAFHLDQEGAWEAYVEPALNYNLTRYSERVEFNPNYAAWQLAVGVNYRFRNRDGRRHFRYISTRELVHDEILLLEKEQQETDKSERLALQVQKLDTPATTTIPNKQKAEEPTGIDDLFGEEEQAILSEPEKPVKTEEPTVKPVQTTPTRPVATTIKPKKEAQPSNKQVSTTTKTAAPTATAVPTTTAKPATTAVPAATAKTATTVVPAATAKPATPKKAATKSSAASSSSSASMPTLHFKAGESNLSDEHYNQLIQVANQMKSRPRMQLIIKGQSTHTTAVRNALIRRFGINASRLSTASGTTDSVTFSEK